MISGLIGGLTATMGAFFMKASLAIFLAAMIFDFNESPLIKWPATEVMTDTVIYKGKRTEVRATLESFCFFNHPSLPTGTVIVGRASFGAARKGRVLVMIKATRAVLPNGRVVTFAERCWSVEVSSTGTRRCMLPKGTKLISETFVPTVIAEGGGR